MSHRKEQKRELKEKRLAAEKAEAEAAARKRRSALIAGGVGLVALLGIVVLIVVSQSGKDDAKVEGTDLFANVPQKGIAIGDEDAPVTVIEFADLQCPFCRDFAIHELPGIVKDYVKPGDVRMELHLLAFIGADSETGRQIAAAAAQQDRIWPLAENVYSHQGTENTGYLTEDFMRDQGEAVEGLDIDQAISDRGSEEVSQYEQKSEEEARKSGATSTPAFLVGPTDGKKELVDADGLRDAIDKALAETKG